jgi:hypothetical protein
MVTPIDWKLLALGDGGHGLLPPPLIGDTY